jgi:hypothetical protein
MSGERKTGAEPGIFIRRDMNAQALSDYLSIIFPDVRQTLPEGTMMQEAVLPVQIHHNKISIIPKITFENPYHDSVRIVKGNRRSWHTSKLYLGKQFVFIICVHMLISYSNKGADSVLSVGLLG